jgi:hypothetical protein
MDYPLQCAICGAPISTRFVRGFFCRSCYKTYKSEIKGKAEWVVYLQNEERKRRYREQDIRKMGVEYVYGLGFVYDYNEYLGLVALREYYEEFE